MDETSAPRLRIPLKFRYCSLRSCKNNSGNGSSIFNWPKIEAIKNKWKNFMAFHGNSQENIHNSKTLKLCENHFDPSDIIKIGMKTRLKQGAVPLYEDINVSRIYLLAYMEPPIQLEYF